MDYKLQVKPAALKKGQKYKIIEITDVAFHTAKKSPTPSIGLKIRKAFAAQKPDRIYTPIQKVNLTNRREATLELLKMDPDFLKFVQKEEAKGYKVLISLPKNGIPVALGKDAVEFIHSKNGKRLLRGRAKEKGV